MNYAFFKLCTFCYAGTQDPSKIEKDSCVYCKEPMCQECIENSKRLTAGSPLATLGVHLCHHCICTHWVQGDLRKRTKTIFDKTKKDFILSLQGDSPLLESSSPSTGSMEAKIENFTKLQGLEEFNPFMRQISHPSLQERR